MSWSMRKSWPNARYPESCLKFLSELLVIGFVSLFTACLSCGAREEQLQASQRWNSRGAVYKTPAGGFKKGLSGVGGGWEQRKSPYHSKASRPEASHAVGSFARQRLSLHFQLPVLRLAWAQVRLQLLGCHTLTLPLGILWGQILSIAESNPSLLQSGAS